jgi:hypothetical protein
MLPVVLPDLPYLREHSYACLRAEGEELACGELAGEADRGSGHVGDVDREAAVGMVERASIVLIGEGRWMKSDNGQSKRSRAYSHSVDAVAFLSQACREHGNV